MVFHRFTSSAVSAAALLIIVLAVSLLPCRAEPQGALVMRVPGFNDALPSKHHTGYVTVDEQHRRRLFYYLIESECEPGKDPIVLWLNGGPDCSSFDGFIDEHEETIPSEGGFYVEIDANDN